MKKNILLITYIVLIQFIFTQQKILIPMDDIQTNHLKAYGIAFSELIENKNVDWLLNYRGGSFLFNNSEQIKRKCLLKGVKYEELNTDDILSI